MIYDDLVESVRPFILCCIVKGVNLRDGNLRKFFQIQTKIHDSDFGGKRQKSAIGTHDLLKLAPGGFIKYTAKIPDTLTFIPLGRIEETTASELIATMKAESEKIRKVDRRKISSGLYKYLYLVENKAKLACLEDAAGNIICLPPLINSELTKVYKEGNNFLFFILISYFLIDNEQVSAETLDIFVEITSSTSMIDCLKSLEEFLKEMLLAGFGRKFNEFDAFDQLILEPVRIVDSKGHLKAVYPSATDIQLDRNR